jgi:hypothetical protein
MTRPDLLHSGVCDVVGLFDQDYQWHERGQVWATPGRRGRDRGDDRPARRRPCCVNGEQSMVNNGRHEDVAFGVAAGLPGRTPPWASAPFACIATPLSR